MGRAIRSALVAALAAFASPARAQFLPPDQSVVQFTRYQAVTERQVPGLTAHGFPVGPFTLFPEAALEADYNDNIFAVQTPRDDDIFGHLEGSLNLQSDLTGRSLSLSATGSLDRYVHYASENKGAVTLQAYATQDLGANTRLRLIGHYMANREDRESQNVFVLTQRPVRYQVPSAALGITQSLGHLQLQGEAGWAHYHFDNAELQNGAIIAPQPGAPLPVTGTLLDERYRNNNQYRGQVRAEYAQTTALAYFVQGTYDRFDYSLRTPFGGARSSDNWEVLGGARFELPVLARGEIGFGYLHSSYQDIAFRSFSGLAIRSNVAFFPTQLLTVTLNGERAVNDAGLPNSTGYVSLVGGVAADYELLRQLILGATFRYENDSFNGIDRNDDRFEAGARAEYRLRNGWALRLTYDHLDLTSNGRDQYKTFARNRVLLGLRYRI